jgi:hypothetical protein
MFFNTGQLLPEFHYRFVISFLDLANYGRERSLGSLA